jgi:hypothetical protein
MVSLLYASTAQADGEDCHYVCAPAFTAFPSVVLQNLFSQARVRSLVTGRERELDTAAQFGMIFNLQAPTQIPRISPIAPLFPS